MHPSEIEDIGADLHQNSSSEAAYRTAINRYYFASHLIGKIVCKRQQGTDFPGNAEDHQKAIEDLQKMGMYTVGEYLDALREERVKADYNTGVRVDEGDADTAENLCEQIKNKLQDKGIYPSF